MLILHEGGGANEKRLFPVNEPPGGGDSSRRQLWIIQYGCSHLALNLEPIVNWLGIGSPVGYFSFNDCSHNLVTWGRVMIIKLQYINYLPFSDQNQIKVIINLFNFFINSSGVIHFFILQSKVVQQMILELC